MLTWAKRLVGLLLFPALLPALHAAPYDSVAIEPVKTSIYIGNVKLTTTLFERRAGVYSADYKARVVPFFFHNEEGHLWVEFTDEQISALERGERVHFTGMAENTKKESRRIEGHATPVGPGEKHGKIKVRVFVTPKIELIFNSTYRFE